MSETWLEIDMYSLYIIYMYHKDKRSDEIFFRSGSLADILNFLQPAFPRPKVKFERSIEELQKHLETNA